RTVRAALKHTFDAWRPPASSCRSSRSTRGRTGGLRWSSCMPVSPLRAFAVKRRNNVTNYDGNRRCRPAPSIRPSVVDGAVQAIARVAEARHDEAALVEALVEGA